MKEIGFQSAAELAAMIRNGRISSREMLGYFLERANRLNPGLNAIVHMNIEAAQKRAEAADQALSRKEVWGPLHGLPMTVKDTLEVAGMPCTSGSPTLADHVPKRNADVVRSFLEAGAVVFGKTNVPIYGGDFQSYNDVYGQSNNPWDPSRTPGGSSGGAAAALAAGLCGLDLGSDIGGSIRTPAHFCGIYGHKPSYGIISQRGHIPPAPGVDPPDYPRGIDIMVVGPLGRSIADIELSMDLLVQPKPAHRKAWSIKLPPPRKNSLQDYKIALWADDPACRVDPAVGDALQTAVDTLCEHGVHIETAKPDIDFAESHRIYLGLLGAVMGAGTPDKVFHKWLEQARTLSSDDEGYLARHLRGATQYHRDWVRMDLDRQKLRQKWADFFAVYDALICPPCPVAAFAHDHRYLYDRRLLINNEDRPYMDAVAWAGLAGVANLPATVLPVGRTPEGLPVGMQLVGPYLEDWTPIHAARLMSVILGGYEPPPGS
jgi:amidase